MKVRVTLVAGLVALGAAGFVAQQYLADQPPLTTGSQQVDAGAVPPVTPQVSRPVAAPRGGKSGVPLVDASWVDRAARATGIPHPAVTAYARATLGAPKGCQLGWTTLAGIGFVESQHGTIDGRTLGRDGRSSSPILGPALDGGEGLAAIRASAASAALHGNPTWDHAMGPMQFIPSSWSRWSRDGDGDGVEDPHDIDDAAASAAAYLCHDGHDLTTSRGWNAAIFSYNHDNGYVNSVYAAANRYGLAVQ
ncbi:lytic transglycosylase domain-containing protein [Nocardioides jishulii]|uniref:Lytic murein transglycosylase n=1 Tax=Nocardioides jishulii TaxID=2575440 RepID=A0A4U2YSM5_9ACTN|nr:lytic murein transglycosylase [Nocardioides jishulii]QCX26410.1 lytic murein transglycosylase [Nocardioides jishulii]TKI63785.1 lytic murein transglycosylase [Nocardioides jishulii]